MAKILYVENNSDLAHKIVSCLKRLGHEVVYHSNLKVAQDDYDLGFNLVICSASLQRIDDGLEWALKLHREHIKVLVFFRIRKLKGIPYLNESNFSNEALEEKINKLLK